jgi:inner membrane protein YidH
MPVDPTREDAPRVLVPATARDFLANERTFLAYARTALAFIGFGFVIARFSLFTRELAGLQGAGRGSGISVTLGVVMVVLGIVVGAYGAKRYIDTDTALRRSEILALAPRAAIIVAEVIAVFGALIAIALYRIR